MASFVIQKKGVFDFELLIKDLVSFFKSKVYDVTEKENSEMFGGGSRDLIVRYEFAKAVDEYFSFHFKVEIESLHAVSVVDKETKKKKLKMEVHLKVEYDLKRDYSGMLKSSFIKKIYEKYIIPERIDKFERQVYLDGNALQALFRERLELQ